MAFLRGTFSKGDRNDLIKGTIPKSDGQAEDLGWSLENSSTCRTCPETRGHETGGRSAIKDIPSLVRRETPLAQQYEARDDSMGTFLGASRILSIGGVALVVLECRSSVLNQPVNT